MDHTTELRKTSDGPLDDGDMETSEEGLRRKGTMTVPAQASSSTYWYISTLQQNTYKNTNRQINKYPPTSRPLAKPRGGKWAFHLLLLLRLFTSQYHICQETTRTKHDDYWWPMGPLTNFEQTRWLQRNSLTNDNTRHDWIQHDMWRQIAVNEITKSYLKCTES